MKTVKKLLALLLAMVMILGMLPLGTLAQENGHDHLEGCTGEDCTAEGCTCRCHYRHLDTCLEGCTGTLAEGEACECDCHFVHLETCLADCTGTVEVDGQTQECACECHDHIEECVENCVGETKDGEACACSCHHTVESCTLDCAGEDCDCVCHEAAALNLEKPEPETKCATCGSAEHTTENHPKEEPKDETKCATCNSTEHTTENHPADVTKCETCGSAEHTTENHPADETKCETCGSTEHTTENHPADETKCGICGGDHADADCTYCLLCKGDNSQCVICEECGTHAGDHTSTCTKRPCETCKKDPCECKKICETCKKDPCECNKTCETCKKDPCECKKACEICKKDPCVCELEPVCNGKTDCPVKDCPNPHCTGYSDCPIENCPEEHIQLCETCGALLTEGVEHKAGCPLYDEERKAPPVDSSVFDVAVTGVSARSTFSLLGARSQVTCRVASAEEADALSTVPATSDRNKRKWTGLFHIESDGPSVITISNLPEFDTETIEVRHYLDDAEFIQFAIEDGTAHFYTAEGLSEIFPVETAAMLAVDPTKTDTICYELLSTDDGTVLVDAENSITFTANSFSLFGVDINYVTPIRQLSVAALSNLDDDDSDSTDGGESGDGTGEGDDDDDGSGSGDDDSGNEDDGLDEYVPVKTQEIVTNKTVIYDEQTGEYRLKMEAFTTGQSQTIQTQADVPCDIVLVIDQSGSMDYCMLCGDNNSDSKHCLVVKEPATNQSYYFEGSDGSYYKLNWCSDCEVWAKSGSNHFTSSPKHTDNGFAPIDGTKYNSKQTISSSYTTKKKTNIKYYARTFYTACSTATQRGTIVKNSINSFLDLIYADAKGQNPADSNDDIKHRVAMVGFAGYGKLYYHQNNKNQSIPVENATEADEIANDKYKNAYYDVTSDTDRSLITDVVNKLTMSGSTYTWVGMRIAQNILSKNTVPLTTDTNGRNQVVVMLTDGAPNKGGFFNNAHHATNYAKTIKQSYGATIYTIGIFSGADGSSPSTLPTDSWNVTDGSNAFYSRCNRFMHTLSSNYPGASGKEQTKVVDDKTRYQNVINPGSINPLLKDGESYYLSAGNEQELKEIFKKIFDSVTTESVSSKMGVETVMQDVVSDHFEIDTSGVGVTAYTMQYNGNDESGNLQWQNTGTSFTPTVSNNTVKVTGFDYANKWVGTNIVTDTQGQTTTTYRGEKLVLEIPIKPSTDGGNSLPTNDPVDSGIFDNGVLKENFDLPTADIPTNVTITKSVVGSNAPEDASFNFSVAYSKFVDYENKDTTVGNHLSANVSTSAVQATAQLKANETYQLNDGTITLATNPFVGKEIIIQETGVSDYKVEYSLDNGTTWKEAIVDNGTATITEIVTVNMNVLVRNTMQKANLKIDKIVAESSFATDMDENQSFLFKLVNKNDAIQSYDLVIKGDGDITVKDLPVGTYTIQELTNWSWRYNLTELTYDDLETVEEGKKPDATVENPNGAYEFKLSPFGAELTFTNKRTNENWLSGDSYAKNLWKGNDNVQNVS